MKTAASIPLNQIAFARSGDKGDKVNIGLFARSAAAYQAIKSQVTPQAVSEHFSDMPCSVVQVYPVDNLQALNIVISGALPGGASHMLQLDNMGKTAASALLRMRILAPDEIV